MAGAGRRTFTPGEVLTASNVMNYLQDQAVMNFAGTAARGSAIGTAVAEGMVSYLADTNSIEVYKTSGTAIAKYEPINMAQSQNYIINGAFDIWQRATSFSNPAGNIYTADRWRSGYDGTGATVTVSQQTFTPGAAPVSGYESTYFLRIARTVAGTGGTYNVFAQPIEDVRTLAGQVATVSFWAKADAARSVVIDFEQLFGSGGSSGVTTTAGTASVTTSWQRFVFTTTVPSISGKTVGTSSSTALRMNLPLNTASTIDIWGVQVEAGQTATVFRRNAPSLQAELSTCQRYYSTSTTPQPLQVSDGGLKTAALRWPITMRVVPTITISTSASVVLNGSTIYGAHYYSFSAGEQYINSFTASAEF